MLNALFIVALLGAQSPAPQAPLADTSSVLPAKPAAKATILDGIFFEGRVYFKDTTLRSFLGQQEDAPLNEEALEADRARIEKRYHERGFLNATVALEIRIGKTPFTRAAVFLITAGKRAELKEVSFNGNHRVSDAELRKDIFSREPRPFGALTKAGFFHKPYLDQDGQRLIANFYRFGFLEARVQSTRVTAWPGLDGLSVHFDVFEGNQYEIASIEIQGELLDDQDPLAMRKVIELQDGDLANLVDLQQQANALLDPLREAGHPFARFDQGVLVAPAVSGREDRKGVAIILKAVRGPAATVRNIVIVGNKTSERVIRRDVKIKEGEPYRHSALFETQKALMQTGFFRQAIIRAVPTEKPDVVDIEIKIQENQTFVFNIAPAFLGNEGWVGIGVLADRNVFGTGLSASVIVQLSLIRQLFDFSLTEPRLLGTRVSLTGELHRRELVYQGVRSGARPYKIRSEFGAGVRVRSPAKYGFSLSAGMMSEYTGVVALEDQPLPESELLPVGRLRNVLNIGVAYDLRDNPARTRNGLLASVGAAYTGAFTLAGIDALDSNASLRLYYTPFWDITLKSRTSVGAVFNPRGGDVAVTDRTFLGGTGSIRGYFPRTIGPDRVVAQEDGQAVNVLVGGTRRLTQNTEIEFPLWPNLPVRGFAFVDMGNAFGEGEVIFGDVDRNTLTPLPLGMFYSVGGGVAFEIPVLPLRLVWSVPLTKRAFDRDYDFFLGAGSSF